MLLGRQKGFAFSLVHLGKSVLTGTGCPVREKVYVFELVEVADLSVVVAVPVGGAATSMVVVVPLMTVSTAATETRDDVDDDAVVSVLEEDVVAVTELVEAGSNGQHGAVGAEAQSSPCRCTTIGPAAAPSAAFEPASSTSAAKLSKRMVRQPGRRGNGGTMRADSCSTKRVK